MGMSSFSLTDRVAIVTGGGTGIGRSIALEFAEFGADVVVSSRKLENLKKVADEVKALGRQSLAIVADVTKKTDVDHLVQRTMEKFGRIDILVNNAGVGTKVPIIDVAEDEWDLIIDTNLKSSYYCCQAVGKQMIEQKMGNIINITSGDGKRVSGGLGTSYNVAKAGVIMLTQCLAWDLGKHNIRINSIAPGFTKTQMAQPLLSDPELLKMIESRRPLGRIGEPGEIASAALFLASDASSYITGRRLTLAVVCTTNCAGQDLKRQAIANKSNSAVLQFKLAVCWRYWGLSPCISVFNWRVVSKNPYGSAVN